MARYEVTWSQTEIKRVTVDAKNEKEAKEIVMSGETDNYRLLDADYTLLSTVLVD